MMSRSGRIRRLSVFFNNQSWSTSAGVIRIRSELPPITKSSIRPTEAAAFGEARLCWGGLSYLLTATAKENEMGRVNIPSFFLSSSAPTSKDNHEIVCHPFSGWTLTSGQASHGACEQRRESLQPRCRQNPER